jgi:hypothetical protein
MPIISKFSCKLLITHVKIITNLKTIVDLERIQFYGPVWHSLTSLVTGSFFLVKLSYFEKKIFGKIASPTAYERES